MLCELRFNPSPPIRSAKSLQNTYKSRSYLYGSFMRLRIVCHCALPFVSMCKVAHGKTNTRDNGCNACAPHVEACRGRGHHPCKLFANMIDLSK